MQPQTYPTQPPPPPVWDPATNQWTFPTQAAAPAAPVTPASNGGGFSDPQAKIDRPRWETLYGRLLIIEPLSIERGVVNELARPDAQGRKPLQDRMTMDVTILDGAPFTYGGRPNDRPPVPDHLQASVPCEFRMLSSHKMVISQCEHALPTPGASSGGKVLARLGVSDREPAAGQSRAYRLQPATDADRALAAQYVASKANKALGVPAQGQPGPQAQPAQQGYAPQPPAAAMAQPAQLDIDTPPVGFPQAVWETMNAEQRTAIAQSAAARPAY